MYERILVEDGKQDADNCRRCDLVGPVWLDQKTGFVLCETCIIKVAALRLFEAGMTAQKADKEAARIISES